MGRRRTWFEDLFGFEEGEHGHEGVRSMFDLSPGVLTSASNGRAFAVGTFTTPTLRSVRSAGLESLRSDAAARSTAGRVTVCHVAVDDIMAEHHENPGATFQAASQFNCLEFAHPGVTPEWGVTGYASDRTQGPACALACAGGTVFRNYFVEMPPDRGQGQTAGLQIDTLHEVLGRIDNDRHRYFRVANGYVGSTSEGLAAATAVWSDDLGDSMEVGLHETSA